MTIEELKANKLILFEVVSGSCAFGLATENSNTDIRGIYYLPKDSFLVSIISHRYPTKPTILSITK